MFDAVHSAFDWMPLGAVVAGKAQLETHSGGGEKTKSHVFTPKPRIFCSAGLGATWRFRRLMTSDPLRICFSWSNDHCQVMAPGDCMIWSMWNVPCRRVPRPLTFEATRRLFLHHDSTPNLNVKRTCRLPFPWFPLCTGLWLKSPNRMNASWIMVEELDCDHALNALWSDPSVRFWVFNTFCRKRCVLYHDNHGCSPPEDSDNTMSRGVHSNEDFIQSNLPSAGRCLKSTWCQERGEGAGIHQFGPDITQSIGCTNVNMQYKLKRFHWLQACRLPFVCCFLITDV